MDEDSNFLDVSCLWVNVYRSFEETHCLHLLSQKSNLLFFSITTLKVQMIAA